MPDKDINNTSDVPILGDLTNENAIDKCLQLASFLKKLSPEDAKKAIEKIPELVPMMLIVNNGIKEVLSNLSKQAAEITNNTLKQNSELTDAILKQNAENMKSLNDVGYRTLDSLEKVLSNENLKSDDVKWGIEKQVEIIGKMKEIDLENKKFMKEVDLENKKFLKETDSRNKMFFWVMATAMGKAVVEVTKVVFESKKKKHWWHFGK